MNIHKELEIYIVDKPSFNPVWIMNYKFILDIWHICTCRNASNDNEPLFITYTYAQ